jgi:glycine oxidase
VSLKDQHIAIAGAGIIGLSAALAFADAGARVTVFESGRAMEQSSWAAAGMLAADDPENDPRLSGLSRLSRSLYPGFLQRVEALSGLRVPLRTGRTLQGVARGSDGDVGPPEQLPPGSLLPGLLQDDWSFRAIEESCLDPRDLCAALPLAARAAGVVLREQTSVTRVRVAERGVLLELLAAETRNGTRDGMPETISADHFLLAAGAWSGQIACLPGPAGELPAALPVAPRKGQMLEVRLDWDAPQLTVVIRTPKLYLVPRGDGRVVIGATVEYAGFDRAIDPSAGHALLQQAAALWPPILRSTVTAEWTGLRPGSSDPEDPLPIIGLLADKFSESPRLWAATGHFRNGILLAPGTAHLLRAMLEGAPLPVPAEDFAPERFNTRI